MPQPTIDLALAVSRRSAGWTQRDIAKEQGLKHPAVSKALAKHEAACATILRADLASREELVSSLLAIVRGQNTRPSDCIRAISEIAKLTGLYTLAEKEAAAATNNGPVQINLAGQQRKGRSSKRAARTPVEYGPHNLRVRHIFPPNGLAPRRPHQQPDQPRLDYQRYRHPDAEESPAGNRLCYPDRPRHQPDSRRQRHCNQRLGGNRHQNSGAGVSGALPGYDALADAVIQRIRKPDPHHADLHQPFIVADSSRF